MNKMIIYNSGMLFLHNITTTTTILDFGNGPLILRNKVKMMNDFGVTFTYAELLWFRKSAAVPLQVLGVPQKYSQADL